MKPCPLCLNPGGSGDVFDLYVGMLGHDVAHCGCGRCGLQVPVVVINGQRDDAIAEARRRWDFLPRPQVAYEIPEIHNVPVV